jgi:hypothetical protein
MYAGSPAKCFYTSLTASYEVFENMFIDLSGAIRMFKQEGMADLNTNTISAGIRWNMFRRDYEY